MAVSAGGTRAAFDATLQEMVRAVEGELAALRSSNKDRWRRIGTGQRLGTKPDDQIYGFPAGADVPVPIGQMVQLAARDTRTAARVLARNGRLVLRCFDDLGPRAVGARICWDTTWLLEELRSALERLPPVGGLQRLLLDPRGARTGLAKLDGTLSRVTRDLNFDQTRSVRRAVGSDYSLVWGPPGAGKTTTLAALAESWYHDGTTLLVTAWSNRTVDRLLLAIAERLEAELPDRRILRVGPIMSRELRERYGRYVATDGLHQIGERTDVSCFDLADAVREVLQRYLAASCHPDQGHDPVGPKVQEILSSDLETLERHEASVLQATEIARGALMDRARIVATTLPRCYLPDQLERQFDGMIVDEASAATVPALVAASARATKHLVVAGDPRQLPPVVHSRDRLVRKWMERDAFAVGGVIPPRPGAERPKCLSVLPTQYRMHPDIAAMVSELAYGKRLETASSWTPPSTPPPALDGLPLVLIDTSGLPRFLCAQKTVPSTDGPRGPKRTNLLHTILVGRLLRDTVGTRGSSASPSIEAAVITPYRKQMSFLEDGLASRFPATFSTVHGAQGEEYDTVIVDLPSTGGVRLSPFMRARGLEHNGARMLNVAASRARDQLIVVADLDYFRPRQREAPFAWRFLRLVRKHASKVLDAEEVLRSLPGPSSRTSEPGPEFSWKDVSAM